MPLVKFVGPTKVLRLPTGRPFQWDVPTLVGVRVGTAHFDSSAQATAHRKMLQAEKYHYVPHRTLFDAVVMAVKNGGQELSEEPVQALSADSLGDTHYST